MMTMLQFFFSHSLTVESQIVLAQTMKNAFGVVETAETKRGRVYTAMKAIERIGTTNYNHKLAVLFAKMYLLTQEDSSIGETAFAEFAEWARVSWNSTEILPDEVVPAIELLYVQYHSVKNLEAKALIDWV
ncbi:hypothetical protein PMAYCL1PPCAC_08251, partial [Pristionchus mayeri]